MNIILICWGITGLLLVVSVIINVITISMIKNRKVKEIGEKKNRVKQKVKAISQHNKKVEEITDEKSTNLDDIRNRANELQKLANYNSKSKGN